MLYRYEFVPKNSTEDMHQGVLCMMEEIFDDILDIVDCWAFIEDHLPEPACDMHGTISYFTQRGNKKFRKSIKKLCKAIEESGKGTTRCITIESVDPETILYKDAYQVVITRKEE